MHTWHGNALALARAWSYILANGGDGLRRVAEGAVLNANWLRHQLRGVYDLPYDRPNMHEFVASTTSLKKAKGVRALDVGKRLLEEGFHAPTVYFPLIVDEALMIEPTETESPQTVAALAEALISIAADPEGMPRRRPGPRRSAGSTKPGRPGLAAHLGRGRRRRRAVKPIASKADTASKRADCGPAGRRRFSPPVLAPGPGPANRPRASTSRRTGGRTAGRRPFPAARSTSH